MHFDLSPMDALEIGPGNILVFGDFGRSRTVTSREDRLWHFLEMRPGTTLADIRYSAGVHKADFQKWRRGELKSTSVMSERIDKVLSGAYPLMKKPPKSRNQI